MLNIFLAFSSWLWFLNKLLFDLFWQVVADPSLSLKQRSLVTDAARALDKAKMMRFDEKSGNFYCTELGRIASHFYIQYSSVETYNEMLRRHMNDSEVICCDLLHLLHVYVCLNVPFLLLFYHPIEIFI